MRELAQKLVAGAEALRMIGEDVEASKMLASAEEMLVTAETWAKEAYKAELDTASNAILAASLPIPAKQPVTTQIPSSLAQIQKLSASVDSYYRGGLVWDGTSDTDVRFGV